DTSYSLAAPADTSGAASGNFGYTATEGEGTYSFYTLATDKAANTESPPSSPDFQVQVLYDTTAPVAVFDSTPNNPTNSTTANFSFHGTDPNSGGVSSGVNHLECKLDSGSFATCTSPQSFPVTEGSHTFQVRAVDNAGNVGDAVSYTWTVDATAPTASKIGRASCRAGGEGAGV